MRGWIGWTGGAILLGVSACAVTEMPDAGEGAMLFAQNCAVCHGASARGDGDLADGLAPKPADLIRIAARNNGQFPSARVLSTIDGYARGKKAPKGMPEFGLLLEGDTVPLDVGDGRLTPTPRPLAALLAYLQSIQS
jgi:mono/diheme cytochrome c family protein